MIFEVELLKNNFGSFDFSKLGGFYSRNQHFYFCRDQLFKSVEIFLTGETNFFGGSVVIFKIETF